MITKWYIIDNESSVAKKMLIVPKLNKVNTSVVSCTSMAPYKDHYLCVKLGEDVPYNNWNFEAARVEGGLKKNTKIGDKVECTALSTSTTTEPKGSKFVDSWVHDSSPLDIDLDNVTPIILPPLIWLESETIPLKMSIRNIGTTCIINIVNIESYNINVDAEYSGPRPSLNGSILQYPYEFSSFHFHWGTKQDNGSEHRTMGKW
ncbi:hypothetical protein AGLY_012408 [Aphis glycines]|uniref:Alpha-carbonic anhydrase domain-containing protein n=1 Tax=Aphis glycines TaxID=307491 RepID=A0A6G0TA06_APHGL|nr:hypothetical protein AGLY_012408 [Aphis glycines]